MNPSTGTFITMDEYAGSIFEPVSLHKYLYANANPVMYSDPSGYSPLTEMTAGLAIKTILIGTATGAAIGMLHSALKFLDVFYSTPGHEQVSLQEFLEMLGTCMLEGAIEGAKCGYIFSAIYVLTAFASPIAASWLIVGFGGIGMISSIGNYFSDVANGHTLSAIFDCFTFALCGIRTVKSYGQALAITQQIKAGTASSNPKYQKASLWERITTKTAKITDVYPNPYDEFSNPKVGPSDAAIARHIKEYSQTGSLQPIEVQKLTSGGYEIVDGHHRWYAAQKIGLEEVPIKISNYKN